MTPVTQSFLLLKLAETLGVIAVILIASTSGRLVFRPVDFKYPQREGRFSAGLFVALFLLAFFFYRSGLEIRFPFEENLILFTQQLTLAVICLAATAGVLFYRRQPLLSAGWGRRQNFNMGLRLGLMLVFLTIFLSGKISALIDGVTVQEGVALLIILAVSLAEESIFRGYLQLRFSSWLGKYNGWLLTSALFVLWRLPYLVLDLPSLWVNLGLLLVQSALLGWIMQKSGHVLAPGLYRAVSDWLLVLK